MLLPDSLAAPIYNSTTKMYDLTDAARSVVDQLGVLERELEQTSGFESDGVLLDPAFGPLGRSPVEQKRDLLPLQYLSLAASGAVCTSFVRTALHPVDAYKTALQLDTGEAPDTGERRGKLVWG